MREFGSYQCVQLRKFEFLYGIMDANLKFVKFAYKFHILKGSDIYRQSPIFFIAN